MPSKLSRGASSMQYTLPGGRVLDVEVIARIQMSPGAFDDNGGVIVCTAAGERGWLVFRVGALLSAGEAFASFETLEVAFVFALACGHEDADAFLNACREAVEAEADDPMGTHHGRNE